ncbi:MAG: hypothetical protein D6806_13495 [Deltaproteobacteria bacterium]|nr:MAG: hypothetical protein D6806_13495 [Deltaproteobacteria bacterium]
MVKEHIDRRRLKRSAEVKPSPDSHIRELDDVVIQVTQVFCPNGHNLIRPHDDLFDGAPGIHLRVSHSGREGIVILSPFHGDHRRRGEVDFSEGTRVKVVCPECGASFPELGNCGCRWRGRLFKLYLTPEINDGQVVALCDAWGCHRSQVFDQAQLLSAFIDDR